MNRRFTDHELYVVRNQIPIQILIETKLKVPNKIREGIFRFLSPCCREFNTGIKKEKNLARCFRCDENFNTIDMVIAVMNLDFVNSVLFLQQFHKELSCKSDDRGMPQSSIQLDVGYPSARREKCVEPVPIKDIIEDMTIKAKFNGSEEPDTPFFSQKGQVMFRLEKLENELLRLTRQIEQIHTFLQIQSK